MSGDETVLGGGRFDTDAAGYRSMVRYAKPWPQRTWAIEGCQGIGKHVALRLLAENETVVDGPPKMSVRARMFATGQGPKTDETEAHSVAVVKTASTRATANLGSREQAARPRGGIGAD